MAAVAAYSLVNDAFAMGGATGAHNWILLVQFGLEFAVVFLMGQQLWAAVKSIGSQTIDAASRFSSS